jgi:predicted metal-dependent peptidase
LALDASGSISDEQYKEFLGECLSIFNSFSNIEAKVWVFDAAVQKEVTGMDSIEVIEELRMRKGYGGTNFKPVFEKAEEDQAKLLIVFTDLMGDFPEYESIRTLWIRSKSDLTPPFGVCIDLEDGEVV